MNHLTLIEDVLYVRTEATTDGWKVTYTLLIGRPTDEDELDQIHKDLYREIQKVLAWAGVIA